MERLRGLVKDSLYNGDSLKEHAENFDWEEAAFLAVDSLYTTLFNNESDKKVCKYVGAITSLGLEVEDLEFLTQEDIDKICKALS